MINSNQFFFLSKLEDNFTKQGVHHVELTDLHWDLHSCAPSCSEMANSVICNKTIKYKLLFYKLQWNLGVCKIYILLRDY